MFENRYGRYGEVFFRQTRKRLMPKSFHGDAWQKAASRIELHKKLIGVRPNQRELKMSSGSEEKQKITLRRNE